jgi:hypothetical protein
MSETESVKKKRGNKMCVVVEELKARLAAVEAEKFAAFELLRA